MMSDAKDPNAEAGGSSVPQRSRPRARCKRLLLAEDDAAFRKLLQQALVRDGYDVVAVEDGTELLERLVQSLSENPQGEQFDMVVSDVRMPGWTGINVLATVAGQQHAPPVLLMTAFGDERLHEQAKRAGAIAVLDKPFEIDDLCDRVDRSADRVRG
jgi:CheY-like chemotaxis protein